MHSFLDKDLNTVYLLSWSFFAWTRTIYLVASDGCGGVSSRPGGSVSGLPSATIVRVAAKASGSRDISFSRGRVIPLLAGF